MAGLEDVAVPPGLRRGWTRWRSFQFHEHPRELFVGRELDTGAYKAGQKPLTGQIRGILNQASQLAA